MRLLHNGLCIATIVIAGCSALPEQLQPKSFGGRSVSAPAQAASVAEASSRSEDTLLQSDRSHSASPLTLTAFGAESDQPIDTVTAAAETLARPGQDTQVPPEPETGRMAEVNDLLPRDDIVDLNDVIAAVYQSYPLLQAALRSRDIALGEHVAASGEFDLKLKGASENGPTEYYQTYRQSIGLVQPLLQGGEVFAGYRVGRGDFQPWFGERQTNNGGEFKLGVLVPLAQNRDIDERRSRMWQAAWGRELVEPEIQAQLIAFVQEASFAYWDWVAAGANYSIVEQILHLAEDRNDRIRSQVEAGLVDPPELIDNERLIAERRAKLADARRKLQQTAAKLSLYLRDESGTPIVPDASQLPGFPEADGIDPDAMAADIQLALAARPEISVLNFVRRQLDVEFAQASNTLQPQVDAVVWGSQDTGLPTSSKRDKSEFEMEASVYVDVPLQRRKARGKLTAVAAKISQLSSKRRLVEDKISVEVQAARAALIAAHEQIAQANEAVRLAEDLAVRERQNFDAGASDLLKVTLREQYAVESAQKLVDARQLYFLALADYRAALAQDTIAGR